MIAFIVNFLVDRKERKQAKAYRAGFGWAMSAYYVDEMSIVDIEYQMVRGNRFDRGVLAALVVLSADERYRLRGRCTLNCVSPCANMKDAT